MRKTLRDATVGVMVTLGLAGVGPTASADQSEPLTTVLHVRDTAHVPEGVVTGVIRRGTGRVNAQTPVVVGFLEGDTHAYVRGAVEGAAVRLGRPSCQALLADFSNASGVPLSTVLAATGKTPAEVFARLRFFEDRDSRQCVGGTMLAFTQIGSQVIRVCGWHFRNFFRGHRSTTEFIMIHEFLHTLGLGENPPTSQAITRQVEVRCGV